MSLDSDIERIKMVYIITGAVLLLLISAFFIVCYICYRMVYGVPKEKKIASVALPMGEQYDERAEQLTSLINAASSLPFEEITVKSRDGLKLYGRYYEANPDAPIQIMFHGYRSYPMRDFCGGIQIALNNGCNAIVVDQRAHGKSEGRCLSFGVNERYDALDWADYAISRFGKDSKIILTGLSMGAATVLMASELELPKNVVGIIADCGYSSPREIIRSVIKYLKYPLEITYFLSRISGKIYGGFDIESSSPVEAVRNAKVPILFIHGNDDRFVPYEMSLKNLEACASEKELLTVPGAGHGISYPVDPIAYENSIKKFLDKYAF